MASTSGDGAIDQRQAYPGPGHEFATSGPCKGSWRDTNTGSCIHGDFPASSPPPSLDDTEIIDAEYLLEITSADSGYCAAGDYKFVILYVTTQNRTSRYTDLKDTLRAKAERADYFLWKSARQTSGKRHVRYVCDSGQIRVREVILPNNADDNWSNTKAELRRAGNNHPTRKYLAFLDWSDPDFCGRGEIFGDDSPLQTNLNNNGNMIGGVYLRACASGAWAIVALHEIGHVLGAVQPSAPNSDGVNDWHPRDEHDVMAYGGNTKLVCTN